MIIIIIEIIYFWFKYVFELIFVSYLKYHLEFPF